MDTNSITIVRCDTCMWILFTLTKLNLLSVINLYVHLSVCLSVCPLVSPFVICPSVCLNCLIPNFGQSFSMENSGWMGTNGSVTVAAYVFSRFLSQKNILGNFSVVIESRSVSPRNFWSVRWSCCMWVHDRASGVSHKRSPIGHTVLYTSRSQLLTQIANRIENCVAATPNFSINYKSCFSQWETVLLAVSNQRHMRLAH